MRNNATDLNKNKEGGFLDVEDEKMFYAMKESKMTPEEFLKDMDSNYESQKTKEDHIYKQANRQDYGVNTDMSQKYTKIKNRNKVRTRKFGEDVKWKGDPTD